MQQAMDLLARPGAMTMTTQAIEYATLYWDGSDEENLGWAANVVIDGEHTSTGLDGLDEDAGLDEVLAAAREWWHGSVALPDADEWREVEHDGPGWEYRRYTR